MKTLIRRLVTMAVILLGAAMLASVAHSAPIVAGDIQVERIVSPFSLPDSSEERWLETRRKELERYRKILRVAYDKVGKRSPKWDEPARESLEALARILTHQIRPMATDSDVTIPAQKAIDAGCDDPLILYARLEFASGKYGYDADTRMLKWVKIAEALAKDTHPAHWRVVTLSNVTTMLSNSDNPSNRTAFEKFAAAAVIRYGKAFVKERDSWSNQELRDVGLQLQTSLAKLAGSPKAGFEKLDRALQAIPEAKATRLQLKAAYEHQTAYRARGTGPGSSVDEDDAKTMAEFLTLANGTLAEAWKADPTDTWVPWLMLDTLKGLGGEKEEFDREAKLWFDRGMKADPNDYGVCAIMLDLLDAKWRGSRPELVAFGRDCLKSKNVLNKQALLVVEAHLRIVVLEPNPDVRRRYLTSAAVRKDVEGAISRYFEAVPDDRSEACRIGMYYFVAGDLNESWKWFAKSEDYMRGSGVFSSEQIDSARRQTKAIMTKLGYLPVEVRRWEKLAPPETDAEKGPDRIVAEWALEQGSRVTYFDVKQKKQMEAKRRTDLPAGPIEMIGITMRGRRVPKEMPPLEGCKKLKGLAFFSVDLRPAELERLGSPNSLMLDGSTIDDAGVAILSKHASDLRSLVLRNTQITDEGIRTITETMPKLGSLNLTATKVTDRSIEFLSKAPTLVHLDINATGISSAGFQRLYGALPKCEIYSSFGDYHPNR